MNYLGLIAVCLGIISVLLGIQYMNTSEKLHNELKHIRTKCINVYKHNKIEQKMIKLILEIKKNTGLELYQIKNIIMNLNKEKKTLKHREAILSQTDSILTQDKKLLTQDTKLLAQEENLPTQEENLATQEENLATQEENIKENFKNYTDINNIYSSYKYRGFNNKEEDKLGLVNLKTIQKLSGFMSGYEDLFKKTFERIEEMDKKDKKSLFNSLNVLFTKGLSPLVNEVNNKRDRGLFPNKKALNLPNYDNYWCKKTVENKSYCFSIPHKGLCSDGQLLKSKEMCDNF
jgi:hypothetical protein